MPLLKYFGWVGSFLVAALFAANWCFSAPIARSQPSDVQLNQKINIRIHSDRKWPERVVFDTTRARLAPAEDAQAETEPQGQEPSQEPSQEPVAERHNPIEAFAEMGRETVEGCLQPPCSADQNPESDAPPKRKAALLRSHPGVSRAAKAFTFPNRFHKLPGKS
jgi:hypothetical protein